MGKAIERTGEPQSTEQLIEESTLATQMDLALLRGEIESTLLASVSYQELKEILAPYQLGESSWYGPGFAGRPMANGEKFNPKEMVAAHPHLPLGTQVIVLADPPVPGKLPYVMVTIKDRGPYAKSHKTKQPRILDLSQAAFEALSNPGSGTVNIRLYVLPKGKSVQDLFEHLKA